jgi:hypothetical protein
MAGVILAKARGGGSGSGSGVTVATPVEIPNNIITIFTVSAQPQWVVADGIIYFDGAGYTYAALQVTMNAPPSTYVRAMVTGGSAISVETPSQVPNGSITVFTVSAQPRWVVSDGITYFEGFGYTYAALQITFTTPPSSIVRVIV